MTSKTLRGTVGTLGLLAAMALPAPSHAALISITPSDDRRGIDGFLDGMFDALQFDPGQNTVTLSMFFEERAALEFPLAALPADAQIVASALTLHLPALPAVANSADVHGYAGDGVVQVADLDTANLLTGFAVNALSVSVPIPTAFLQGLLDADEPFAGFVLRNVTVPTGVFSIWTIDAIGQEAFFPRLDIEYESAQVPEPGTLLLAAAGLAVWRGRARRRRRTSPV